MVSVDFLAVFPERVERLRMVKIIMAYRENISGAVRQPKGRWLLSISKIGADNAPRAKKAFSRLMAEERFSAISEMVLVSILLIVPRLIPVRV